MRPSSRALPILVALGLSACASLAGPESAVAPTTVAAGVTTPPTEASTTPVAVPATAAATFSDAQADRGRASFRASCTDCHYSSEFRDSHFKFKWSRRSAGNLYQLIQTSMPEDAPGSLSPEEAVDLLAYILRMNGFEPGQSEVPPDRAVLDGISLRSIRDNQD